MEDLKPISSNRFAINERKAALADFNPYSALRTMNTLPCSAPNSGPARIQCFSKLPTDRNVFCTSYPDSSKSFNAATSSRIRTESLDTTVLYVTDGGDSTRCPSATNRTFLLKFSDSLTSNIRCPVISSYPISSYGFPSYVSKAIRLFFISVVIASCQSVSPFSVSILLASFTFFGTHIPYLWVRFQYFDLTVLLIAIRFFNVYGTHQAKAGFFWSPFAIA